MENLFIGISGIIGAGKSTLATALGKALDLPTYYEPVDDNEYLADFYKDIRRYSFQMQIYLLNRRFHQHQQIIWHGRGGVQDRTIYEDPIFAKMLRDQELMDPRDYETYISLFQNMSHFMCKPNLIVYLDVSPEISLSRIESRGRGCEQTISLDYLQALYAEYERFLAEISRVIPVLRVGWNEYKDVEELARAITAGYAHTSFLRDITKWV